ncbi:MAG: beta-galactosidase [Verrucomicrobia bacterium]|nr:beta-galactosidase [Verrucomicrobiota bacterium]
MRIRIWVCLGPLLLWFLPAALGEATRQQLDQWLDSKVHNWRWHLGEAPRAEQPDFGDSQWDLVDLGFKWWPHDSTGWFRTRITVPETINGIPIKGGSIRMRAGVDNAAQAYVNGVFKQEFEWSKGDFVLTDKAQPGEVITVALHAINRPGSGSLYEAWLVNGSGEALVEGLRGLVKDIGTSLEDGEYVPAAEAAHARALVREALQALDLRMYQACNRDAFLASVEKARDILLSDRATVEERLKKTAENLEALKRKIRQGREGGRQMAYQAADARVVESFLRYLREDLAENHARHQLRGLKGAAYIDWLCLEALQGNAASDMAVPQYQTAPWTIRSGAFWQNGRPVYFTGVGHFGQVRQVSPMLSDYGLKIIEFEMGPANGLPTPDTVDLEAIRQNVVRWLDQAAAHNVAVNLLISPHYFPQWAFEADPAHRQCGQGFLKFCIEAPNTRVMMEKWLDALMPLIAHHPALHSICLSNEPQYQGRCAYERARFQEWLRAKWGSIRKANEVYGTDFRRFEDIELPQNASPYGLYFDRWRFNQDRFVAFHTMLRERIHRYDPDLPVHAKVMSHAFEDPGRFEVGIDYERFTQLDRIAGNDCVMAFTGEGPGEYACDWQTMAMNYTLQHSVAPDRPIFNSENHLIGDGDTRYIPENYIRTVYWQEAVHGQGATTTWVWERGQSGDLAENILTRANCVRAFGRVALDLQRLAPEVHALSQAPAQLAILYGYSSLLPSKDYVDEARAAFEGAYFTDAVTDFVSERQIESGKLARYKLVVVPRASHAPDGVVQALNEYIRNGGTVMTVGLCVTQDEYGRVRQQGLVSSGRGRLVVYPDPLTAHAYRDILDRLLDQAGASRPIQIAGAHGEPVWGVNVRAIEENGRLLVNLLNLSWAPQQVQLVTKPAVKHALNLMDCKQIEFPFTLSPLEPLVLALRPR